MVANNTNEKYEYEYYNLRGVPARLVLNDDGDKIGSEVFNVETEEFQRSSVIAQILSDPHCDDITEDECDDLCDELISKKKVAPPEPEGLEM